MPRVLIRTTAHGSSSFVRGAVISLVADNAREASRADTIWFTFTRNVDDAQRFTRDRARQLIPELHKLGYVVNLVGADGLA